jgi:DNA-directed RNA polymerase subunit L
MAVATGADTGATFALENEDHTLANALRYLLNMKFVPALC